MFYTELVLNVERKEIIIAAESEDEYSDEEKDIATDIKTPMKSILFILFYCQLFLNQKTSSSLAYTQITKYSDTTYDRSPSIKIDQTSHQGGDESHRGDSLRSSKIKKSSSYRVFATISPNESEFKNAIQDLIFKFEKTAGMKISDS